MGDMGPPTKPRTGYTLEINFGDIPEEYREIPEHTLHAIQAYVELRQAGGHFLNALLSNDLRAAVTHADRQHRQCLCALTVLLCNRVPAHCWGCPQTVESWLLGVTK